MPRHTRTTVAAVMAAAAALAGCTSDPSSPPTPAPSRVNASPSTPSTPTTPSTPSAAPIVTFSTVTAAPAWAIPATNRNPVVAGNVAAVLGETAVTGYTPDGKIVWTVPVPPDSASYTRHLVADNGAFFFTSAVEKGTISGTTITPATGATVTGTYTPPADGDFSMNEKGGRLASSSGEDPEPGAVINADGTVSAVGQEDADCGVGAEPWCAWTGFPVAAFDGNVYYAYGLTKEARLGYRTAPYRLPMARMAAFGIPGRWVSSTSPAVPEGAHPWGAHLISARDGFVLGEWPHPTREYSETDTESTVYGLLEADTGKVVASVDCGKGVDRIHTSVGGPSLGNLVFSPSGEWAASGAVMLNTKTGAGTCINDAGLFTVAGVTDAGHVFASGGDPVLFDANTGKIAETPPGAAIPVALFPGGPLLSVTTDHSTTPHTRTLTANVLSPTQGNG